MISRRSATWFTALASALATIFLAVTASAQSISVVNEQSLPRLNTAHQTIQKRSLTLSPEAVSLQDCVDDQLIRFTLQMADFTANAVVQVWASNSGQDCKNETSRGGGVQVCWKVLDTDIGLQTTVDVDVPVRRIMAGVPPFGASRTDSTANVCGRVDLSTVSVHLLYFAPGNLSVAAFAKTVGITVDTVGPKPPSGLAALPGNTRIQVTWANISGGSADAGATGGLTELTGVNVYCDPSSSGSTTTQNDPVCHEETVESDAGDAGADDSGDAASGTTTTTVEVCEDGGTTETPSGDCTSPNFAGGDGGLLFPTAEFNAKYLCGSITGNSGTTVLATELAGGPLANGTRYAVAVAATDKYGNVGTLSAPVCQTPNLTTDFWDDYKRSGGKAGGGCDTGGASPLGSLGVLGLIGGAAVVARLRRRTPKRTIEKRSRR